MRKITRQDAEQFGHVWTHQGVAIPLRDIHYDFATDFANIVLRSFIEDAQRQAAAAKALQEKMQPKIIVEGT